MKKLAIVLMLVLPVYVMGQYSVDGSYDKQIDDKESAVYYNGTSAEITSSGDSTWYVDIFVRTADETIFDCFLDVDSVGGTSSAANEHLFFLSYAQFPGSNSYTAIGDTVSYAGTADTTFVLSSGSTAVKARQWRINCIGETDSFYSELDYLLGKIWK